MEDRKNAKSLPEIAIAKVLVMLSAIIVPLAGYAYETDNFLEGVIVCAAAATIGVSLAFCLILLIKIYEKI